MLKVLILASVTLVTLQDYKTTCTNLEDAELTKKMQKPVYKESELLKWVEEAVKKKAPDDLETRTFGLYSVTGAGNVVTKEAGVLPSSGANAKIPDFIVSKIPVTGDVDLRIDTELGFNEYAFHEGSFVECQYNNKDVYIKKNVVKYSDLCTPIDEGDPAKQEKNVSYADPKDRNAKFAAEFGRVYPTIEILKVDPNTKLLTGDKTKIANAFYTLKPKAEGEFSLFYGFNSEKKDYGLKVAPIGGIPISEIQTAKGFANNDHGLGFYGCFVSPSKVFLVTDMHGFHLNKPEPRADFRKLPKSGQIDYFINALDAMMMFHKAGFIHNNINTHNLLRDSAMNLRISDYVYAQKAGSMEWDAGSSVYKSPNKATFKKADPFNDLYSIAVCILELILATKNDIYFTNDPDDPTKNLPDDKFPVMPSADPNQTMSKFLEKFVVPEYGAISKQETDVKKMNFPTMLYSIIVGLNESVTAKILMDKLVDIKKQAVDAEKAKTLPVVFKLNI